MEGGKYEQEWYDNPSRIPPSSNPFPEGGHLLGNHDTHQGEIAKKTSFPSKCLQIQESILNNIFKSSKY